MSDPEIWRRRGQRQTRTVTKIGFERLLTLLYEMKNCGKSKQDSSDKTATS